MIGLSLHPPLHLSHHLTQGQRVTAVHCGPVLTHITLWTHMQSIIINKNAHKQKMQTKNTAGSILRALTRILYRSRIPTRMPKVEPGKSGNHRHSPNWWAKDRSKQQGTRAPRTPTSTHTGQGYVIHSRVLHWVFHWQCVHVVYFYYMWSCLHRCQTSPCSSLLLSEWWWWWLSWWHPARAAWELCTCTPWRRPRSQTQMIRSYLTALV